MIYTNASGASQYGFNQGQQTIGNMAYGASQHGYNLGIQTIGPLAYGAEQRGYVGQYVTVATNNGIGSIQLLNLASNQKALMAGHASLGLGACVVTNDQAIVAGDGLVSHGAGTVTARGFYGDGSGLMNLNSSTFATGSITSDKLAIGAVTAANLGAGSVGSSALAFNAVTTEKLADGAVTTAKLATGSVGTNKAVIAEWNVWGDDRYLKLGSPNTGAVLTDGSVPMTGNFQMGENRITGLADATADRDAVNLKTMTNAIQQALLNVGPFGDVSMGTYTTR
jgi:hypothetical protein